MPRVWEFAYEQKLTALHKHALQIGSAKTLNAIAECTLDAMESGLGFDVANIAVVDKGWLRLVGHRGSNPSPREGPLDGRGVTVKAANSQASIRVRDTRKEAAYVDTKGFDWIGPPSMLSELAVPVLVDGKAAAVLNVESYLVGAFRDEDQQLLETLASHVAMALSRLRHDEMLLRSEESLRALFNATADAVVLWDANGTILATNDVFAEMVRRQPEEIIGMYGYDLIPPEAVRTRKPKIDEVIRSGKLARFEDQRNGVWFDNSIYPILDAQGKVARLAIFAKDITEQKRLEEELRRSTQFLETIVQDANVWLNVLDQEGNVLVWNKAAETISGYSKKEVIGHRKIWERLYPDEEYRKRIMTMPFGSQLDIETNIKRKDSESRIICWNERYLIGGGGGVSGSITIGRDITEQKRMEGEIKRYSGHLEELVEERTGALRESERKYRQLIETAQEGLFTYDSNGLVTFVNPFMSTLLGYGSEEIVGKSILLFVDGADLSRVKEGIARRKQGIGETYEIRLVRKDASRILVSATTSPIMSENGEFAGGLALLTDITQRRKMEQRLKQAEHLAGIGETAAMVGHDLRNPLQGIASATYLLRDESLTMEEKNSLLQLIENCVDYSDGIVKDLLDYARPFDLRWIETTPKEIASNALQAAQVPGRVKVENMSKEQPKLSVDPDRMKRAFVNLVENAVDAMPNGGTLTVNSKESNGYVEILLSDTGVGMPKEALQNLWRPLQTTKAKGMGMGLAIVKRIIDAHNGEIAVESKQGEGTTISVRMPTKQRPKS